MSESLERAEQPTLHQRRMLRHALGIDRSKESYRNHYCACPDNEDCRRLVELGLMEPVRTGLPLGDLQTFRVTAPGRAAAALRPQEKP